MSAVHGPRYLITSRKVLSPDERERLTRLCRRSLLSDRFTDRRSALMILLALECGLRASEVLGLRVKDFQPEQMSLFISPKKGSRARELPLRHGRARELRSFVLGRLNAKNWNELDPEARIFPISYFTLRKAWVWFRPHPQKVFHSLRHSFAVDLYTRAQDIRAVQLALGHRSIMNTMVYMDFYYSQTALRRLMHGRAEMGTAPGEVPEPLIGSGSARF